MYKTKKILAVIPARKGSKGLPGKNIVHLAGKPLIYWSIEAARESECFDDLVISTDGEEIAELAREFGVSVPFIRPAELATDDAKTIDVILHLLSWYEQEEKFFDLLVLLQPTSPLRTAQDIQLALSLFFEKKAKSIVSVCEADHHPYWMNTLPADLDMSHFLKKEAINIPRQQLPKFYRLNGAIYIANIQWLKKNKSFFGERTYGYVMDRERSVDIDQSIDLRLAEIILNSKLSEPNGI